MKLRIDEITADIEAADFTDDAATSDFTARMCSDYSVRELFAYEDFLPCHRFATQGEKQRLTRIWKRLTSESRSLIIQARALGAGAIKDRLIRGTNGKMLPYPYMDDDLDDGLYDMSVTALRLTAARAIENNATVQDVAAKIQAPPAKTPAGGTDGKILTAITDVKKELKAARDDIGAVAAEAKRGADAAESNGKNIDFMQTSMNDGFDAVCQTVGEKFGDRVPPFLKDLEDDEFESKLYKVYKAQTKKHETDRSFTIKLLMETNTKLTYRGYTIKELCRGDDQVLRDWKHKYDMKLRRSR